MLTLIKQELEPWPIGLGRRTNRRSGWSRAFITISSFQAQGWKFRSYWTLRKKIVRVFCLFFNSLDVNKGQQKSKWSLTKAFFNWDSARQGSGSRGMNSKLSPGAKQKKFRNDSPSVAATNKPAQKGTSVRASVRLSTYSGLVLVPCSTGVECRLSRHATAADLIPRLGTVSSALVPDVSSLSPASSSPLATHRPSPAVH